MSELASERGKSEKQPESSEEPIKVNVKFFTTLREMVGKRNEEFTLPPTATVENLLEILCKTYGPSFAEYLFEGGKLRSYLQILVDGKNVNLLEGLKTRLKNGTSLAILPPAGGG
ncbi:ubiquitin-like small modifier protein 1 [Candidatus Hecatella orcuttiae]|uniref:ubiquitin-like small modifier protein 1 n=1 Tax=Candidatus Hecatella orcuttiae TaxID=1935119 RepID=UPI002867C466|nr:ubiquitin-like small modifier protein 1 [Candidatus Hecatella orcuttiae]